MKYALTPEEQEAALFLLSQADSYLSLLYYRHLDKSNMDYDLLRELQELLTRLRIYNDKHPL